MAYWQLVDMLTGKPVAERPQPFEQEDWYKEQGVRWAALARLGWVFSSPDVPHHPWAGGPVGIRMMRADNHEIAIQFTIDRKGKTLRELHTWILEQCEAHATGLVLHSEGVV